MANFRPHFRLPKLDPKGDPMIYKNPDGERINVYYNIDEDEDYRDFMLQTVKMLEPRFEPANEVIIDELDSVFETIFILDGNLDIGFSINGNFYRVVRYTSGNVFGAFETVNIVKSQFIYKTSSRIEGYFIRQEGLYNLRNDFPSVFHIFQDGLTKRYY
jgi:hypothetical protein